DKELYAVLAVLAGALTISPKHSLLILAALLAFFVCSKVAAFITDDRVKAHPIVVFFSMAIARAGIVYAQSGVFTTNDYVMAVV
ncbi:stage II sporulation protein E, partial [Bacillus vallismortis]|nr:stage II sporulation protein E [Bacillus vallismortis]